MALKQQIIEILDDYFVDEDSQESCADRIIRVVDKPVEVVTERPVIKELPLGECIERYEKGCACKGKCEKYMWIVKSNGNF